MRMKIGLLLVLSVLALSLPGYSSLAKFTPLVGPSFVDLKSTDFGTLNSGKSLTISTSGLPGSLDTSTSFSISFWYQLNTLQSLLAPMYFGAGCSSASQCIYFVNDGGTGNMDFYMCPTRLTSTVTPDMSWHHVVLTNDSAGPLLSFYFDGVLMSTSSTTFGYTPTEFSFGGTHTVWGQYAGFKIDDTSFYDSALNLTQVGELYNSGKVKNLKLLSFFSHLKTWWEMGDAPGDNSTTVNDVIGSVAGSLTGSPAFSTSVP